jgi:hypothetical protein
MKLLLLHPLLLATILSVLSWSTSILAADVIVTPTGDSTYSVQGSNVDGVAGIQLDFMYDTTSFIGTPTVTQGNLVAGAMLAANTSRPGSIKIAIISTRSFSGSGQIATISFTSKTGNGGLTLLSASMIDSKGSPIASTTGTISNDLAAANPISPITPASPINPANQNQTSTTNQTSISTGTTTTFGTVTLPGDLQQKTDTLHVTPAAPLAYTGESAPAAIAEQSQSSGKPVAEVKAEETPQYVVYKGISDRFKQYAGSRELPVMAALFDKKIAENISQEPAILVNNGQSLALVTVDIPARIKSSPNFAVNGGTMVSFRQDKQIKGRWIVEILPEAQSNKIALTIISGAEEFEFPLTAVPTVKSALTFDERGWDTFIAEVGTKAAPLHDLNNDGVRDSVDEYIFVAHYLLNKASTPKTVTPDKAPKNK